MSNDTEKIRILAAYSHDGLIRLPITLFVSVIALFIVIGPSALFGLSIMLVTGPLTAWAGALYNSFQDKLLGAADKRVNLTNEILQGIRIIKYFAWEPKFNSRIRQLRDIELNQLVRIVLVNLIWANAAFSSGIFVTCVTFYAYTGIFGNKLDAATAFTALKLLHQTSANLGFLPEELVKLLQARVSFNRIMKFLKSEELEKYVDEKFDIDDSTTFVENSFISLVPTIGFRDAWFSYHTEKDDSENSEISTEPTALGGFTLRNISIDFPLHSLTLVAGPTGCGKTSLLLALLGELKRIKGHVYLPDPRLSNYTAPGSLSSDPTKHLVPGVAYVAQSAWLLNSTIRENILFGLPFEETRYKTVLESCALTKDLQTLDCGDLTEIGEKGINLSGGQKQRISLARAAYSRAEIVLLDDPLSAVDAPTARHIFNKCILGTLNGRTRILVTHAVPLILPKSDFVVVMKSGDIVAQGKVLDVSKNVAAKAILGPEAISAFQIFSSHSDQDEFVTDLPEKQESVNLPNNGEVNAKKLVEDEERSTGSVKLTVYKTYYKAAGGKLVVGLWILSFLILMGMQLMSDMWLSYWTNNINNGYQNATVCLDKVSNTSLFELSVAGDLEWNNRIKNDISYTQNWNFELMNNLMAKGPSFASVENMGLKKNVNLKLKVQDQNLSWIFSSTLSDGEKHGDDSSNVIPTSEFIFIYSLLGLCVLVADNLNWGMLYTGVFLASRKLHSLLLDGILRAPMRFFETTPTGRILNRFSRDLAAIDQEVVWGFYGVLRCVGQVLVITVIVSYVVPPFLIFLPPLAWMYIIIASAYLNASRELKRLEAVSRSPVYSLFSETLQGVVTIRAYGQEARFENENFVKTDINHRSFFYLWAANRWLCLRTDVISATVVFVSGIGLISSGISPGWAGLCLSYTLEFTDFLLWLVRSHADMEMGMNAVERITEYANIEPEPPAILEPRPPNNWPSEGSINVLNLTVKYAPDLDPVLKNLSFHIQGGHKVGVVGRTGAGKSTLSLAFFRIIPFADGSIFIDGIDIEKVGLHDLRSRLTIIPQDPILFSGTLRQALDPLDEHYDMTIWSALRRVNFLESMQHNQDNETTTQINNEGVSSSNSPGAITLDSIVSENGANFSQGQRQLLCLARALLRHSKLVLLDEATASVDSATDMLIQQTIRTELDETTVLTIAHRLRTVVDYDRIMVLDNGRIVEYDTPYALIQKNDGLFRKMAEETGEFEEL
ncbi:hypothetical protein HK096_001625, partial [Nowakowskiella sp. JEL0078]